MRRSTGEDQQSEGRPVVRGQVAQSSGDRQAKAGARPGAGQLLDEQRVAAGLSGDPAGPLRTDIRVRPPSEGDRGLRRQRLQVQVAPADPEQGLEDGLACVRVGPDRRDQRDPPDQALDDRDGAGIRPLEVVHEQDVRADGALDLLGSPVRVPVQVQVRRPGEGQVWHPGQRREAAALEAPALHPIRGGSDEARLADAGLARDDQRPVGRQRLADGGDLRVSPDQVRSGFDPARHRRILPCRDARR